MRWTPGKLEELRGLAHLGSRGVADQLGCARAAARHAAENEGIHLGPVKLTDDGKTAKGHDPCIADLPCARFRYSPSKS
jgi:hypothetical protein